MYTANLARGLARLGHDVIVSAPKYDEDATAWDQDQPYSVERMPLPAKGLFRRIASVFRLVSRYWRHRPDVVLLTEAQAQIGGALVVLVFPLPYAVTIHGSEIQWHHGEGPGLKRRLKRRLLRRLLHKARKILCVSSSTRKELLRLLPNLEGRATVVHNGIDLDPFDTVSAEWVSQLRSELGSGPVVLTVGRLIPEKGHDMVLQATARLVSAHPGLRYLIVGDGPDRPRLQGLVRNLSLTEHVVFTGKVCLEDLLCYYALCDVFAMVSRPGSRVEGFGLVYAEAGACSKPVVAGRTGGVPEVVEHGYNGLLVDPHDESGVADAIGRLLKDPALAREVGQNNRKRVEEEFSCETMARKTMEVLVQ